MNISELLKKDAIITDLSSESKDATLSELTTALIAAHPKVDHAKVVRVLEERETLGSTGIGDGIAIPHGKVSDIDQMLIAFGRSKDGIDFDSMDGKPAHIFFLLLAPEGSVNTHLKALARISKLLKNQDIRSRLLNAESTEDIIQTIKEGEEI